MLLLLAVYIEVDPKLEFKTASFSSSEVLLLLLVSEHSAQWIEL